MGSICTVVFDTCFPPATGGIHCKDHQRQSKTFHCLTSHRLPYSVGRFTGLGMERPKANHSLTPKKLKEHGNGNVFERAKSVRSFVFVGYAKLGLYNKPLSFHGYMVGPRSLPQAVTKAKVLGSCFSRTCHHMSSLFTWQQCDQESILCDLFVVKTSYRGAHTQKWFGFG